MPSKECRTSNEFFVFAKNVGLRDEHVQKLWDADIRTVQELASAEKNQLRGICNNTALLNVIHPLLNQHALDIIGAADPYATALSYFNQARRQNTVEEMEVTATNSDAAGYGPDDPAERHGVYAEPHVSSSIPTTISNTGGNVESNGGSLVQSNVGRLSDADDKSVIISGGNFVQANVMGNGPVTYNNTGTTITTNLAPGKDGNYGLDIQKLSDEKLNDGFYRDGKLVKMANVGWTNGGEYWVHKDLVVRRASEAAYNRHYGKDDVYGVSHFNESRALIINNYQFQREGVSSRRGAERDSVNLERTFKELGFKVTAHANKTADEIMQILREFAKSTLNIKADMIAVYIGSHGERDGKGEDEFYGADGVKVKFGTVKKMFSNAESLYLENKPKMFFLQFCREDKEYKEGTAVQVEDTQSQSDSTPTPEDHRLMDYISVYATVAGNRAYRDTAAGSWFVTALVRVLSENAKEEDLLSMITKVNSSVADTEGKENGKQVLQISEVLHSLRKKIHFWPGIAL